MANKRISPVELFIQNGVGRVRPPTILVNLENGVTFQEQPFSNQTDSPVTVLLPGGISPDGCVFGIEAGSTAVIRVSACAPRRIEIPYGVFFADESVRDWGQAASPPTMKVGP